MGQLSLPEAVEASAPRGLAVSDAERVRKALAAALAESTRRGDTEGAAGGWQSAGMVIRYTRRETAKRGAVAQYLENRQEPLG